MVAREDGTLDFHALRSKHRGPEAVLYAFDLLEHDGADLRDLPLIERKRRLGRLIGDEGIVSKRVDAPYRSGPSKTWLKSKNPASEAVRRERQEEWR